MNADAPRSKCGCNVRQATDAIIIIDLVEYFDTILLSAAAVLLRFGPSISKDKEWSCVMFVPRQMRQILLLLSDADTNFN